MGGIPFFASLLSLIYLAIINPLFLVALIDKHAIYNFMWFVAGLLLGIWFAGIFIRGYLSVFIHELKHSALSNLVGNKFVAFKIRRAHGHFKYKYTKETAKFNAIISLAPYFFPIITIPGIGLVFVAYQTANYFPLLLLGFFFGNDLLLSYRDIGEHQSDLTEINGGYYVGLAYVLAMNTVITTILLAWVLQRKQGLNFLLFEHLKLWSWLTGYSWNS